jgi:hypothetical protein
MQYLYKKKKTPKCHTEANLILTLDVNFIVMFKWTLFWFDVLIFEEKKKIR